MNIRTAASGSRQELCNSPEEHYFRNTCLENPETHSWFIVNIVSDERNALNFIWPWSVPEEGSDISRSSILRHACKGTAGTDNFSVSSRFRFIQVLELTPNPRICKRFPLNTTFLCVQVPFRRGLTVSAYIGYTITVTAWLGDCFRILRCLFFWLRFFLNIIVFANIEVVPDGGFVERGWLQWKISHPNPQKCVVG